MSTCEIRGVVSCPLILSLGSSLLLWIVVQEPFWLEIHCLRNLTSYCFINLRCQHAASKDGPGSFRLGIRQPGSSQEPSGGEEPEGLQRVGSTRSTGSTTETGGASSSTGEGKKYKSHTSESGDLRGPTKSCEWKEGDLRQDAQ